MGPLKGRHAWNDVPAPTMLAGTPSTPKPAGWAGSAHVSSTETPDRLEQAGGMKSDKTNQSIGRGGVGKSTLKSPSAEAMPKGMMDGGKY